MNILLHICCAPCSIFPVDDLRKQGHHIGGYFFNPNIHPYSEYLKRKDEVAKYAGRVGLTVTYGPYDIHEFFHMTVYNEDPKTRCPACWWLRMRETAKFAAENGFEAFTTTLLASPYQDHEVLKSICADVAEKSGVKFYYQDFRTGFNSARSMARSNGMYMQKYCGCLFSEKEGLEKKDDEKNIN